MTTTNLALPEVSASQSQKEVTINDTFGRIDGLLGSTLNTDVSAGGTFALSAASFNTTSPNLRFTFSGTPAAAFTVQAPASVKRFAFVRNSTLKSMTVRQSASPGLTVTIMPGEQAILYFAGSSPDTYRVASAGHIAVRAFMPGVVAASTLMHLQVAERPFVLGDDLLASQAFAATAPSGGAATFDVERNGTAIGTITFADGSQTATFATTGSTTEAFAVGDRLGIRSQATVSGVAGVAVSLFAYPNG